jgi:HPt (histidine-containing phosphotransfer) domain-containing protein
MVHNRLLEDDLPVTPAMLALIDIAQTSFRVWVDTLRRKGRVNPDATAVRAAIAKVEAEMPAPPAVTATLPDTPQPAAEVAAPWAQEPSASAIEVLELDQTAVAEPATTDHTPPSNPPAEIIEFAPRATPPEPVASAAPPLVAEPAPEPEEVSVGEVTLSAALYRILCDEAQQHLATLDAELLTLQADSAATPSQAMVRAGHTLCGIHRTGGFPLVATTAKALEQCLLELEERGAGARARSVQLR